MANPQAENGHTDIANEIMEAMAGTHWSGYEMQVVLVILRKTYGWHKKEDWISLSSFEKATNIDHTSICRTIKKLINRKIIKKNNKKVSFNKNYDEWVKGVAKSPLAKSSIGGGEIVNKAVAKSPPTKESKETIQKKGEVGKADNVIKSLIGSYYDIIKEQHGYKIKITIKDVKNLKSFLRGSSEKEIKAIFQWYVNNPKFKEFPNLSSAISAHSTNLFRSQKGRTW